MSLVKCGAPIMLPGQGICTSGCLVTLSTEPQKLFMISVCHGLVTSGAKGDEPVVLAEQPETLVGRLFTWTQLSSKNKSVTADMAVIWINPDIISLEIEGIGAPKGDVTQPVIQTEVQMYSSKRQSVQRSRLFDTDEDVLVDTVTGPDWEISDMTYRSQIYCEKRVTELGDSGTVVLDNDLKVVGMVVALQTIEGQDGHTILTPFRTLKNHPALNRRRMEIATEIPAGLKKPDPL